MVKIHLLLKKEEIDAETLVGNQKVAVVLDVLLATSTIVASLSSGAKKIIPVLNQEEAFEKVRHLDKESYCLVGEERGEAIAGFLEPNPLELSKQVNGKTVILSTTNGTVAICKAAQAKKVYIASLLNGRAVSEKIAAMHKTDTIIVICSGSHNKFCIEDFYGAGYFIDELVSIFDGWELTDAAKAALYFYQSKKEQSEEVLASSKVGQMLINLGFQEEIAYISQLGVLPIVPYLDSRYRIVMEDEPSKESSAKIII